jgi:hypothetical protein
VPQCFEEDLMNEQMRAMTQVARGIFLAALFPELARGAMEAERTREHGYCLGLTEDQVKETVAEWSQRYKARPEPLPWDLVRAALTKRVMDEAGAS